MVFYFHAPSGVLFGFTVVQIITEWGNTHFISIFLQKNLHGKFAPKTAKNLDFLEVFCGYIFFIASLWRRRRDLNSRAGLNPTYTLSRGASSANLSTSP